MPAQQKLTPTLYERVCELIEQEVNDTETASARTELLFQLSVIIRFLKRVEKKETEKFRSEGVLFAKENAHEHNERRE